MVPTEALKLALYQEIEAIKLYQRLAAEHPAIKDTLLFLVEEEEKHKRLIEGKIKELVQ